MRFRRYATWVGWLSALAWVGAGALGCGDDAPLHDLSTVEPFDFGDLPLDQKGRSAELTLEVPPDAVSVTLVAHSPLAADVLMRVIDPAGELITSDREGCASMSGASRILSQASTTVAMLPNGDELPLAVGTYKIRVRPADSYVDCAYPAPQGSVPISLRGLWKKVPMQGGRQGPLRGQRLAVNVFLVGDVPHNRQLDEGLQRMRSLYAKAGIDLGAPSIISIDGANGARFARLALDEAGPERELMKLSAMAPQDGVNIFVVKEITFGAGYIVFGVAMGIPGTPERGSERSGLVVSSIILDPKHYDSNFAGNVMAHETGHFLGLYHSTEAYGMSDQISDTPNCPDWRDTNGNGYFERRECLDDDGNNLMFWEGDSFGDKETAAFGTITKGQADIMLRSAATR